MSIPSETGSFVALTFSELIPLSQVIEDSVCENVQFAATSCISIRAICCSYANSFHEHKLKLQLLKHSFNLFPPYFICLPCILQAVHQKVHSTP